MNRTIYKKLNWILLLITTLLILGIVAFVVFNFVLGLPLIDDTYLEGILLVMFLGFFFILGLFVSSILALVRTKKIEAVLQNRTYLGRWQFSEFGFKEYTERRTNKNKSQRIIYLFVSILFMIILTFVSGGFNIGNPVFVFFLFFLPVLWLLILKILPMLSEKLNDPDKNEVIILENAIVINNTFYSWKTPTTRDTKLIGIEVTEEIPHYLELVREETKRTKNASNNGAFTSSTYRSTVLIPVPETVRNQAEEMIYRLKTLNRLN